MQIVEIAKQIKEIERKIQRARKEKAPNLVDLLRIRAILECKAFEFDY